MLRIFHWNESILCLYFIWLSVLIISDITSTLAIMSELLHFMSWNNSVICLFILYVISSFNPHMCYIDIIIHFCHVQLCTNDFNIIIYFCSAQLCTNDYPYYFSFLPCTTFYELLSIIFLVFVMHTYLQLVIYNIFGFCHAHLCTNDYFVPNIFPMRFCKTGIFVFFPCFSLG